MKTTDPRGHFIPAKQKNAPVILGVRDYQNILGKDWRCVYCNKAWSRTFDDHCYFLTIIGGTLRGRGMGLLAIAVVS